MAIANKIAIPFFGMMLLTLIVWVYMYFQRITYILENAIAIEKLTTLQALVRILPESINRSANNLQNFFELPVLFYVVSIYLTIFDRVDLLQIGCAYGFLGLRIIHSIIHCTINIVIWCFIAYILSSVCLWIMVIHGALTTFSILREKPSIRMRSIGYGMNRGREVGSKRLIQYSCNLYTPTVSKVV